jgi:putative nucleotidyltransferase-like protein
VPATIQPCYSFINLEGFYLSLLTDWIVYVADPLGSQSRPPRRQLKPTLCNELIEQADAHGVLGALLRNFSAFSNNPDFSIGRDIARRRHRVNTAFSLMLTREADDLMACVGDLPAAVVKGPVFARALYPERSLRNFGDIDVLIAPEAIQRFNALLSDRGFFLGEASPANAPREWKWIHRNNEQLMIEVQTDLIHADSLRRVVSLPYELIAAAPEAPATLLLIALVHGGAHHFERLQHVVDICQSARVLAGPVDETRFEDLVEASNARFIAVAGLELAGRIFREPRCTSIACELGSVNYTGLAGLLLGKGSVMSTMDKNRARHAWRRQAFRWLMKRGNPILN